MQETPTRNRSILINSYRDLIDFANKYLTLSKYIIKGDKDIFFRIERMMLIILLLSIAVLCTLHLMPQWLAIVLAVIFAQRVLEYVIVYSRNFIFHRGRIFTDFKDPAQQGEWLIMTVSLNLFQLIVVFSIWYRLLGLIDSGAFLGDMTILNSIYFSIMTFLTVGFGDIVPLSDFAKTLVILQTALTFYTLVIVVNGLISIHFKK